MCRKIIDISEEELTRIIGNYWVRYHDSDNDRERAVYMARIQQLQDELDLRR